MAARTNGRRWRAHWALGSLLLHALLLTFAATRASKPLGPAPAAPPSSAPLEVDVVADLVESAAEAQPLAEPQLAEGRAPRAGASLRAAVPEAEPLTDAADTGAEGEGPGDVAAAPPAAASAEAPHLSLSQLGVDGKNLFLDRGDPASVRAAKAARVKRRLDRSLAQSLHDGDVERGRGAGAPVMRSLEAAVYASTAPLNGSASFVLIIDSDGKLVSNTLAGADGDREAWVRVARQTAQALAQKRLAVPKGKGIKLVVALTSHFELPSGADPGLEVNAFGIPIKKGDGPRSTKLDLTIFPFPTATLAGDPADIGARPRRIVRSHVVSEEIL